MVNLRMRSPGRRNIATGASEHSDHSGSVRDSCHDGGGGNGDNDGGVERGDPPDPLLPPPPP
eukprot:3365117-Pyramimonas_sp.AAC.1